MLTTIARDTTKVKLLEAAGEEFADKGFERATIRGICERAGANIAAVNYHFGDKEQLYARAVIEGIVAACKSRRHGTRRFVPRTNRASICAFSSIFF